MFYLEYICSIRIYFIYIYENAYSTPFPPTFFLVKKPYAWGQETGSPCV